MLIEQWKESTNLAHATTAKLCAVVANMFGGHSSDEDFLPFPPPPKTLTIEEAEMMLKGLGKEVKHG